MFSRLFLVTALVAGCCTGVTAAPPPAAPAEAPASASAATGRSALAVETVRLRKQPFEDRVSATGSIAAWQEASVSPQVNGLRVKRVLKTLGDPVRRGEVMLELDDESLRSELAQTLASRAEVQALVAEAVANAQRAREVRDSGALSDQQVQQLLTAETTAKARLKALDEAVQLQRQRLQQAQLRAPDDGVVSFRAATLGAVVPSGFELFRIIRQNRLEWRAEVPSSALALLRPGMAATVQADSGSATGKVRLVSPTVDPVSRNAMVYVDIAPDGAMRPGMFGRGAFVTGGTDAPALPQSAVLQRDGFFWVARLGADRRVRFVKVSLGRRQDSWVEVVSGLAPDADLVASGLGFLAEGDLVRVVGARP